MPTFTTSTWDRLINKRGKGRNDPFEKHLRDIAREGQIRFTLAMRACRGTPCGHEFKKSGQDQWAVVLPEPVHIGHKPAWRVLTFDVRGFCGHFAHATEALALEALLEMGYRTPDAGALDRCQSNPLWGIADAQHQVMLQHLARVIDVSAFKKAMNEIAERHGLVPPYADLERAYA